MFGRFIFPRHVLRKVLGGTKKTRTQEKGRRELREVLDKTKVQYRVQYQALREKNGAYVAGKRVCRKSDFARLFNQRGVLVP
jgi:hypothetical protein